MSEVRSSSWLLSCTLLASGWGCATSAAAPPVAAASAAHAAISGKAIEVPLSPSVAELPRVRVAVGLSNPRGMYLTADAALLVSIAGTGDPADANSGGLWRLQDNNHDGDFDDAGERTVLLDKQPSRNLLDLVRRDEVFGMAGMAEGGGSVLVSLADFGGPSKIFRIEGTSVTPWGATNGNVNDLAYDARRQVWVAVASTTDEVLQLLPGGRSERIVKFPPLASGQDAVPAYLRFDPRSGDILVSLFSGSPEGEEGGNGTEIVRRSASVVRVHAETHGIEPVVVGLTVPSDLEVADDGSLYVLEFCDEFLDPVGHREQLQGAALHGGFKRFTGRLLHVDRDHGTVTVVARGLDAPSNLLRVGKQLYIAEGMGTPGRLIPGPAGKPIPLTGFIERIALP